ncbi:alpha/beta hydrolase [Polaribacter sp.]|uniref:alpha/beta hydrolase n=1 Tax=Polaribacter sp. TaxID=1920175 RepID=UPI003EF47536
MKTFLVTLFLLISNIVAHAESVDFKETIKPDSSVVYKTNDNKKLSLHVFNPEGHKVTDHVPVIVFFFGGGWTSGTPKQFYEQSRYFAQKGIVAISAEYRIKNKHGTTPFDAVSDAKSAIRWVRKHAKKLGINPSKIVAAGGSAGGHVAACTGVIEGYEEENEDLSFSSKPNAMILYNPVLDTTEKGYGMEKVGEERKTDISPNHHVKKGIVPTLVFHGKADKTVPFENAERFNVLMNAAGNTCQLESYAGKDHGFFNGPFFRKKKADKIVYNELMEKSYAFVKLQLMEVKNVNSNDKK